MNFALGMKVAEDEASTCQADGDPFLLWCLVSWGVLGVSVEVVLDEGILFGLGKGLMGLDSSWMGVDMWEGVDERCHPMLEELVGRKKQGSRGIGGNGGERKREWQKVGRRRV